MAELFPLQMNEHEKFKALTSAVLHMRNLQKRFYNAPRGDVKNSLLILSNEAEKAVDELLSKIS